MPPPQPASREEEEGKMKLLLIPAHSNRHSFNHAIADLAHLNTIIIMEHDAETMRQAHTLFECRCVPSDPTLPGDPGCLRMRSFR
jgi:hypothetical protein